MAKTYPAVLLMANHGRRIAIAGGAVAALTATAYLVAGGSPIGGALGYLASAVVWAGMRLGAEMVEVVSETLLPR